MSDKASGKESDKKPGSSREVATRGELAKFVLYLVPLKAAQTVFLIEIAIGSIYLLFLGDFLARCKNRSYEELVGRLSMNISGIICALIQVMVLQKTREFIKKPIKNCCDMILAGCCYIANLQCCGLVAFAVLMSIAPLSKCNVTGDPMVIGFKVTNEGITYLQYFAVATELLVIPTLMTLDMMTPAKQGDPFYV